jgi:hypothetical protein
MSIISNLDDMLQYYILIVSLSTLLKKTKKKTLRVVISLWMMNEGGGQNVKLLAWAAGEQRRSCGSA